MASTQCLRVARFVPVADPTDGDVAQVVTASSYVTGWVPLPSLGNLLPTATKEGDLMQANAALAWVAAPGDGGTN